ncbi:protein-L-isoaspartate O-methyltransferase family protein [Candidatus Nanohalobium constans]|uniref:protein-L-isoaspartate(D-aspartate) O-methyltransferase n=1 Tax=Candidatus Nanohalobium constans TaxID=2565781 RepID=A0A5Q0UFS7_9ARCH|nr:methyltransferase domain-containing protein [Candidatus Nanohalobium constans]QGA80050.1 protein-L-isoaspartate O-methyltransferase [Candidatus Nanohalobium constans]
MQRKPNSNDELVDYLIRQDRIRSEKVEQAFRKVDRADFVPESFIEDAYSDKPLPLNGETISAPHIVAEVTELLDLESSHKVLEIGSGSGYQAAILGQLTDRVIGVEINKELTEASRPKIPENVEIRHGNGFSSVDGKFDRILFSCATENFNEALNFVEDGGVIVGPVREDDKQVLRKWKDGEITSHGGVRYVEMQD